METSASEIHIFLGRLETVRCHGFYELVVGSRDFRASKLSRRETIPATLPVAKPPGHSTNYRGIRKFYRKVRHIWRTLLSRRTRGAKMTWEKYEALLRQLPLLPPRIKYSWAQTGSPA
jgi:hypothetical protein